jgi:hypothetical protein
MWYHNHRTWKQKAPPATSSCYGIRRVAFLGHVQLETSWLWEDALEDIESLMGGVNCSILCIIL